jgi:hypothetical protein
LPSKPNRKKKGKVSPESPGFRVDTARVLSG